MRNIICQRKNAIPGRFTARLCSQWDQEQNHSRWQTECLDTMFTHFLSVLHFWHFLQLEVNENPEGNDEWIQPSFALTQKAIFTFLEPKSCHEEKLLKDKDYIPPAKEEFTFFKTSIPSTSSLQLDWRRRKVSLSGWYLSLRDHTPPCSAVSRPLKGAGCPHTLMVLLKQFWKKALGRGRVTPEGNDFHLISISAGLLSGCYFQRSGLGKIWFLLAFQ